MDDIDFDKLSDADILRLILSSMAIGGIVGSNKDKPDVEKRLHIKMESVLTACLNNLTKLDDITKDLINTKEDLAVERASNRKLRSIILLGATLLVGRPECYPKELQEFVFKIQEEAGTKGIG